MVVNIPDSGLLLESSAKAMAGLPLQAFAITLSDSVIEDMIECVQSGQGLQLSLGSNPAILYDNRELSIPDSPDSFDYDLFYANSAAPTVINKLPQPAKSIFRYSKNRPKPNKTPQPVKTEKADRAATRVALTSKPSNGAPKLGAVADKDLGSVEDDAIANLKNSYARAEAEKRENASVVVDGSIVSSKGGKGKGGKVKLLGSQANPASRSHPGSPAFGAIPSPSLGPTSNPAQDRLKQQRFPIIHELAVQELSFQELFNKYNEGTEAEFTTALNKVADFDNTLQKWALKKMYWKELDVFQYSYGQEEDRQKAIDNAIKQFDKMRLGSSDPLWQKLLPKTERNKGICLSKLQAAIANKAAAAPKTTQKTDVSSVSGADSEKDDSTSSAAKKGKGGEPMSRSSSQTLKKKPSASEAQAKRLANPKKIAGTTAKPSPKVSPTKPTANAKTTTAKGGRVLSKEFVTSSDSDDDEAPLSSSMPKKTKPVSASASAPKLADRQAEKTKPVERLSEPVVPKAKAAPATRPTVKEKEKEKDTIRAQVIAKPVKAPIKRQRDAEDDDSSSSGTPLSKRIKPVAKAGGKAQAAAVASIKHRAPSDASQNSRGTSSGPSLAKSKNTSPVKSSPLASSPPTNASELEQDRPAAVRDNGRGRERVREREPDRDTIVSRGGSSTGSSVVGGSGSGAGRKRPADDSSSPEGMAKRQRLSEEILHKAHRFKQFYSRYEALHKEIRRLENPPSDRVADLVEMHDRLVRMKDEIYEEAR